MRKVITTICLLVFTVLNLSAQDGQPDILEMVSDLQKWQKDGSKMKLVWWIPPVYWEVALAQSPGVTQAQIDDIMAAVRPYTILAAIDGRVGSFGLSYKDNIDLKIVDNSGAEVEPLAQDGLPSQTRTILDVLKPVLGNSIGELGKNMHFFVFDCCDANDQPFGDPKGTGSFTVMHNGDSFVWRLPLGTMVPKKTCPEDGEKLSGAWTYCPWHGKKLENN